MNEQPPTLITVREAARRLSLSPRQVWKLLEEGRLSGLKINRQNWRVRADSVSRFALEATETGTKEERR